MKAECRQRMLRENDVVSQTVANVCSYVVVQYIVYLPVEVESWLYLVQYITLAGHVTQLHPHQVTLAHIFSSSGPMLKLTAPVRQAARHRSRAMSTFSSPLVIPVELVSDTL
jgi:hypothetical protein